MIDPYLSMRCSLIAYKIEGPAFESIKALICKFDLQDGELTYFTAAMQLCLRENAPFLKHLKVCLPLNPNSSSDVVQPSSRNVLVSETSNGTPWAQRISKISAEMDFARNIIYPRDEDFFFESANSTIPLASALLEFTAHDESEEGLSIERIKDNFPALAAEDLCVPTLSLPKMYSPYGLKLSVQETPKSYSIDCLYNQGMFDLNSISNLLDNWKFRLKARK